MIFFLNIILFAICNLLWAFFCLDTFLYLCHTVEYLNFAIVRGDISTKEMSTQGNLLAGEDTNLYLFMSVKDSLK